MFLPLSCTAVVLLTLFTGTAFSKVLVYPTTNPHYKLIAGFGVPVEELDLETLVIGYVFKARFRLPASVLQLRTHASANIQGRRSVEGFGEGNSTTDVSTNEMLNTIDNEEDRHPVSAYRWAIYKGLEAIGDRMGLVGRACVLKSICENAEIPFHYHNGLYAEMLHIIFTPSTSVDRLSMHSDNEYLHAEALGRSGAPCERVFSDCKRSLIDQFSDIYETTQGFFQKFTK